MAKGRMKSLVVLFAKGCWEIGWNKLIDKVRIRVCERHNPDWMSFKYLMKRLEESGEKDEPDFTISKVNYFEAQVRAILNKLCWSYR